jgi:hypothetical protein
VSLFSEEGGHIEVSLQHVAGRRVSKHNEEESLLIFHFNNFFCRRTIMSKIYLVCTVLVLGLLLSGNVANAQNQIKNWEFDVPMNLDDVWNFWRSENFTSITIVEGAGLSGQYAMKVDIEPGPPSPLLVFQSNLGLEQGATYTISFMAKADAPRTVNVQLQARSNSPQPWRVFWIETVDLTTEVQTYTYQYTHTDPTVGGTGIFNDDIDLHFDHDGSDVDAYYDHIWMGIGEPPSAVSVTAAHDPSPADGEIYTATWATLGWMPGATAATHDAYLADNFADVNDRTAAAFQGSQPSALLLVGFFGAPFPDGLALGTTYYWAVDEVEADGVTKHEGPVWSFFIPPMSAYEPAPVDASRFEDPNVTLGWGAGFGAILHYVHFGDNFDDVNNAAVGTGTPATTTEFTPGTLEREKTYYWRVDAFAPPTNTKGDVWSFRIGKEGGGVQGEYYHWTDLSWPFNTLVLTRTDPQIDFVFSNSPDPNVNDDNFSARWIGQVEAGFTETYTFYARADDGVRLWIDGRQLVDAWVNQSATEYSGQIDLVAGETYNLVMEYYEDGGGAVAQLRWSSPSTSKQPVPQEALSLPVKAYSPLPGNGAVGVRHTPTLRWSPGLEAASHEVYFGTDPNAVAAATKASPEYVGSRQLGAESYEPGMLPWDTAYYWRVDEINAANPDSPWVGKVWSFTTADFLVVDDFESYDDVDPAPGEPGLNRIFDKWIDGFGTLTNGAIIGNDFPPYAERTIVHGGFQSMIYRYNNAGMTSEATLTLVYPRDWTEESVTKLGLWVRGDAANAADRIFVALNGTAVIYHDDPAATQLAGWNEWVIDLAAFGVNLTNVNTITIGVGTKNVPNAGGGQGTLYFDDIRLIR